MTKKIKTAFDAVRVEDSLKSDTLLRVRAKLYNNSSPRRYLRIKRLTAIAACFVLMLFLGVFSHNIYYTETAYIDFDINPSLELFVNCFNRVIGANAYNPDGEALLSEVKVKNMSVDKALDELIDVTAQKGILQDGGLVSVTVQSLKGNEEKLLIDVQEVVCASVAGYAKTQVDVFPVDGGTRSAAHDLHITPARYLAFLELQQVDPTATVDECREHSITEIRQRAQEHKGHNDSSVSGNGNTQDTNGYKNHKIEDHNMNGAGNHAEPEHTQNSTGNGQYSSGDHYGQSGSGGNTTHDSGEIHSQVSPGTQNNTGEVHGGQGAGTSSNAGAIHSGQSQDNYSSKHESAESSGHKGDGASGSRHK